MIPFRKIGLFLVAMLAFTACGQIDDDLSDCEVTPGPGPEPELEANFQINVITNVKTNEVEAELSTVDKEVADAIREYLKDIFAEYAHDIDLSFYNTEGDSSRLYHESHIMDARERAYKMHLPVRDYMHASMANIEDNPLVASVGVERNHTLALNQVKKDTIDSHNTGLFTGRLPMHLVANQSQTFDVNLYMANCSSALVVDSTSVKISNMRAFATGFATDFQIADSAFVYPAKSPMVKSDMLSVSGNTKELVFCNVNFPSKNPYSWLHVGSASTRNDVIVQESDPLEGISIWRYVALVTLPGGSVTRSDIWVKEPLLAGELKIIKGYLDGQGGVHTDSEAVVGVSITIDWKPGAQFNPVF
ncbi:MAG: hypothetical protein J6U14_09285 [Bacteroidaceae bacterium]|nr:hypothetical protein [Bacteroidaceae bacterium]